MKTRVLALLLACFAAPAAAEIFCPVELFCADDRCFAGDPSDEEGAVYVRDPEGAAPQLYLGEGLWVTAALTRTEGALVWTGTSPQGQAVFLGLRRKGGTFVFTRREPGAGGRVWTATGRCTER